MTGPACEADVIAVIGEAVAKSHRLAIVSGGSKRDIGAPVDAMPLALGAIRGIVDYDPAELVLTVRPGTPLREIEDLLASHRQMLAFEPFDHGPIFNRPAGAATIGGVVAAGVAGSRRVSAGGARDHILGLRAASGRGETFVAGGKVVKNVTGYDLPKLAAGSWGRLFALTELTLKVLPRPEAETTVAINGLGPRDAVRVMAQAMGSQADVAAAAHVPANGGRPARTALRLEGFPPSIAVRLDMIRALLAPAGSLETLGPDEAQAFWSDLRSLRPLSGQETLWRAIMTPSAGGALVEELAALGAQWLLDWAGGLAWIAFDGDPARVRKAASAAGGHAKLVRAPAALRTSMPAFQPQSAGLEALEARVRRAFDPASVFETGRF